MYTVVEAPSFSASQRQFLYLPPSRNRGSERLPGQALGRRWLPKSMVPQQDRCVFSHGGDRLTKRSINETFHLDKGLR